jgi:hypothetical protein
MGALMGGAAPIAAQEETGTEGDGPAAEAAAAEADYAVASTVFLPQQYYVGDTVEARVRVRLDADEPRSLSAPEELPEPAWGEIRRVLVSGGYPNFEVRISFAAYRPGTQTFPPIDLGGITLRGVDLHVASVLEEGDSELAPVRDQLLLPQTRVLLAVVLAVLFGIPLMLFVAFPWVRSRWQVAVAAHQARRPYRKLKRSLDRLEEESDQLTGRNFYIRLLEDARRYLTRRLGVDCMSATTGELRKLISRTLGQSELVDTLNGLFQTGDLVKFAHRASPVEQRLRHIEALRHAALQLEKERRHRRGQEELAVSDEGARIVDL